MAKKSEKLDQTERITQLALDVIHEGVMRLDKDGTVEMANKAMMEILGAQNLSEAANKFAEI